MPKDGDVRDEAAVPEDATAEKGAQQQEPSAETPPSADATEAPVSGPEVDGVTSPDPQEALAELERELAEVREQLLRKSADFENYRKRMLREKEEFVSYANRELLLDLLPVIDDFERAIRSSEESRDYDAFHDGIVMIEKQFTSMLERKWKLTRFDSVGEVFDPQRHEAMMAEEVAGHEHSIVLEDFQKGFLLNERVLRPSKVKVSMPAEAPAETSE